MENKNREIGATLSTRTTNGANKSGDHPECSVDAPGESTLCENTRRRVDPDSDAHRTESILCEVGYIPFNQKLTLSPLTKYASVPEVRDDKYRRRKHGGYVAP